MFLVLGNWSENNGRNTLERPPPPPISASQHTVSNLHHMAGIIKNKIIHQPKKC